MLKIGHVEDLPVGTAWTEITEKTLRMSMVMWVRTTVLVN